MKRKENTRITAETVERMSCPQKPHRPRVLHACEVLATFLEIPAVESSSLAIALAAAAFLPRTATPGVFEESLSASEPSPLNRGAPSETRRRRPGRARRARGDWDGCARRDGGAGRRERRAERDGGGDCAERHGVARERRRSRGYQVDEVSLGRCSVECGDSWNSGELAAGGQARRCHRDWANLRVCDSRRGTPHRSHTRGDFC